MVKKDHDSVRKEKMAEAVYINNSRDLFAEVRKMNTRKSLILLVLMVLQGMRRYLSCLVINMNNYIKVYHVILMYLKRLRGR